MLIKVMLFPFLSATIQEAMLNTAIKLVKECKGHLHSFYVTPDPETFYSYSPLETPYITSDFLLNIHKKNNKESELAHQRFKEIANLHNVPILNEKEKTTHSYDARFLYVNGTLEEKVTDKGKLADILVMGQVSPDSDGIVKDYYSSTILAAIFNTGSPILLLPESIKLRDYKTILIAWDGSIHIVHAIMQSLPLLKKAKRIILLFIQENKHTNTSFDEALLYLESHNIPVECLEVSRNDYSIGAALMMNAHKQGADLIIMGAFSHNRIRQAILGGVTTFMLDHAEIPIFIMY